MVTLALTELIPVEELGQHFPRCRGRKVSSATAWRWVLTGLLNASGDRVKLASLKVAGRRYIRPEAIQEFVEALNPVLAVAPSHAELTRRSAEANRALEALNC